MKSLVRRPMFSRWVWSFMRWRRASIHLTGVCSSPRAFKGYDFDSAVVARTLEQDPADIEETFGSLRSDRLKPAPTDDPEPQERH